MLPMRVLEYLVQDLKLALRQARRRPGFTVVLVLALTVGIGLTTSIFSVFYGVLLRPLPFRDPDRLVLVKESLPKVVPFPINMPPAHALELSGSDKFSETAIFIARPRNLEGNPPERLSCLRASSRLLPMLGIQPLLGRNFTDQEDQEGAAVALISESLATRRFGKGGAVGNTLLLDKRRYDVIGVLPASLTFPTRGMQQGDSAEVWIPLGLTATEKDASNVDYSYSLLARLADGVTIDQARQATVPGINRIIATFPPQIRGRAELYAAVSPLQEELVGDLRRLLYSLLAAVGALLLISCLNVSNMLLSRSVARRREVGVRTALGAGAGRITWQMLHETLFLFLIGGTCGALFALWSQRVFLRLLPPNLPRANDIGIDVTVLAFTLAVSLVTGLIFGLAPALGTLKTDLRTVLQEGARGASGGRLIGKTRKLLVVAQIALTVVLLACAGLLVKSVFMLLDKEAALRTEQVVTFGIALPDSQYPTPEAAEAFYRELGDRLRQIPGVRALGLGTDIPLEGRARRLISPDRPTSGEQSVVLDYTAVDGGYFESLGIPQIAGRAFEPRDRKDGELVGVVNEAFAKTFWPGTSALDRRFKIGPPSYASPWIRIVGVVGNVSGRDAGGVGPHAYVPFAQEPLASFKYETAFVMRTASGGLTLDNLIRNTVRTLDPSIPVLSLRSMDAVVSDAVASRRVNALLVALFGLSAMLLSALGVYGVVAYSVSERTREIGIRLALGAPRSNVWTSVVWEGARLALIGLAIGLPLAIVAGHLLRALLYGVSPQDVVTFSIVLAAVGATCVAATLLPGWRAMHVDPVVSVRNE